VSSTSVPTLFPSTTLFRSELFKALGLAKGTEGVQVGGHARSVLLKQETEDPITAAISLSEATDRLAKALHDLPIAARAPRLAARSEEHTSELQSLRQIVSR